VLRKDLLRVSRAGGGYRPRFATREHRPLAARVLGTFESHVGERRGDLDDALAALEADAAESGGDFKLVRGLAALIERERLRDARAGPAPARSARGVRGRGGRRRRERDRARNRDRPRRRRARDRARDVEASLYADRDVNEILVDADVRWDPDSLLEQYDLSLAQTALFDDATEVRIRSNDPKRLVSAVKRLRLMYEVETTPEGRELVVTGPDALFSRAPGATGPRSRDCSGPSRSPRSGSCRRRSTTAAASAPCASPTAT